MKKIGNLTAFPEETTIFEASRIMLRAGGQRLRKARKEAGYSVREVAHELREKFPNVCFPKGHKIYHRWDSGAYVPPFIYILCACHMFGITLDDVFSDYIVDAGPEARREGLSAGLQDIPPELKEELKRLKQNGISIPKSIRDAYGEAINDV